jgi:hypothetical protein
MADGIQPVGAMVAPIKSPDTFGMLSNILGIQQQKQTLQVQAQQLQQEQIKTQAAQDSNAYFSSFDPTQYVTPNGTTDVTKIMGSDPNYKKLTGAGKVQVTNQLQAIQGKQLDNMSTLAKADQDTVQAFGQSMNSLSTDPDVIADNVDGRSKAAAAAQAFAQRNPEAAKIAGIYSPAFRLADQGGAKQGHLAPAIAAIGAQAQTVSEQQAQSNPVRGSNAAGATTIANKATGVTQLAPTTGGGDVNPTTPQVAGATSRTVQGAGSDFDRANAVSAQAQPSGAAIPQTQRIDDLADQIQSGKFAKWIQDKAAALGVKDPAVVARQLLEKDLGQVRGLATVSAKANTDEKMNTILSGYPDASSAPDTIHGAMDYIRGTLRQNVARSDLLDSYRAKHPDLVGFQHADDVLTKNAPPLMQEYKALPAGQQRIDFFKRNFATKDQARQFRDQVQGTSHVLGQ